MLLGLLKLKNFFIIKNVYGLNNKNVLVIKSLGIYDIPNLALNYILLRELFDLNLERLIKTLNPELIIADASNYKSHILQY